MSAPASGSRLGMCSAPRTTLSTRVRVPPCLLRLPRHAAHRARGRLSAPPPRAHDGVPAVRGALRALRPGVRESPRGTRGLAAAGRPHGRRGVPSLRPSGGRRRADPLPELPGRAPARLLLPDPQLLSELPGQALDAVRFRASCAGCSSAFGACSACLPARPATRSLRACASRTIRAPGSWRRSSTRSSSSTPHHPDPRPWTAPRPLLRLVLQPLEGGARRRRLERAPPGWRHGYSGRRATVEFMLTVAEGADERITASSAPP
jgi:hypothetical protein